jgi:multiple sugar transport system permease protein
MGITRAQILRLFLLQGGLLALSGAVLGSGLGALGLVLWQRFARNADGTPLFALVMATMLLPSFMNMIPTFLIMDALGWIDQHRGLYIPGAASAFGIFLMRQFAASAIPRELIEAARMDGCGEFAIYWRIVLPLLKPALGTLGLITFIASWNNFMGPLIVMRSADQYTLPLALRSLQSPVNTEWGALMTGSAIATIPLLILFALSSRQLISGLTTGAVK